MNLVPTIGAVYGESLCVSKDNSQAWQDQALIKQAPISPNQPNPNNKVISPTLSVLEMKKMEGSGREV